MRVLVTRPEPAASATATRLSAMGHAPLLLSLTRAIHDRQTAIDALRLSQGAVVLTSAEAVRAMGALPPDHCTRPVFCVGPATARAARQAGFTDVTTAGGTGQSLADLIIAAGQQASHLPLLYLAGEPRSPDLEARLAEASIPCRTVISYRMDPLDPDQQELARLMASPPDVILFYSRESVRHFFALAPEEDMISAFSATLFLCISAKTAMAVPPALQGSLRIAVKPDEDSLLALLAVLSPQK